MSHMKTALALARQVLGTTSPNPAVGAVVVKDRTEVGHGATLPPGQSHAEIGALRQAGAASLGATLYSTLEPCCTYGRTPPCTRAIIEAGITQVYVAAIDPNPRVSGRGCAELQAAGIEVAIGEEAEHAQELYEGFAKHINTGIPFVTAKFAMSLDGKIATRTSDSMWITGLESRGRVQQMRRESDAVMVGVNTVLADDPQLTARDDVGAPLQRQPLRVIADSRCRTPPGARVLQQPGKTLIATCLDAPQERVSRLQAAGAEVLQMPPLPSGQVDLVALLAELGRRGVVNLLVEGGGTLLGSLFDLKLVDKVYAFIAPVIIGGQRAASPVEGLGAAELAGAWRIARSKMEPVGSDWLVLGYPVLGN
jgi:diaminohydroxyphosphoribosylaminopyrimidine deaminase/5-amino-6-(5-phosphoribosylamino)uracil reductase